MSGFGGAEVSGERAGGMMVEAQLDVWAGQLLSQIPVQIPVQIPASKLAAVTDALARITDIVLNDIRYLQEGK